MINLIAYIAPPEKYKGQKINLRFRAKYYIQLNSKILSYDL